jgi:protein tyrosine phosphatase (PTP) superfamily phosphohydrolase (DUF442 family)
MNIMDSNLESIFNYVQLSDRLATAGQPTEQQYPAIRAAGYPVVINLALPNSANALPNEAAIAQSLGLEYIAIPVIWENPTLEDFDRFVKVMQAHTDQPVFVHCAANMRVSAFMYLYRRLYEGMSDRQAQIDLHKIWQPNETWQAFMNQIVD